MVILYKLSQLSNESKADINALITDSHNMLILNHPKHSQFTNSLRLHPDISFGESIIEDSNNSLIHSQNQLLVEYSATQHETLISVIPYASPLLNLSSTANIIYTSDNSNIEQDGARIPGPFPIVFKHAKEIYVNSYLFATNYWITQGDNYKVIGDFIGDLLFDAPIITTRDTSDDFIIFTFFNIFKLFLILIILPIFIQLAIYLKTI